ncbi:YkvA family protein [Quadrisphaera setariae]|uniref:YkvA family protein n=1 Tax=Quadrisphaera setariae TaxID=2593304 RepID=UPI001C9D6088|nr:YkvA family protein [Quadrisphaera setariae]
MSPTGLGPERSAPGAARALWTAMRRGRVRGGPRTSAVITSLPRLVPAVLAGRYTGCSRGRLLLIAGAAAYVASPVDLLPEGLLGPIGLADDAAVLAWLAGALLSEGQAFLAWEQQRPPAEARPRWRGRRGRPEVVPGDVVG